MILSTFVLYFFGSILFSIALAERMEFHSFEPPFEDIDNSGVRQVNKHWRTSGHAVVNYNFARLTPDRQVFIQSNTCRYGRST